MTAIKTIELPFGITVEDAIHRIESVTLSYKNKITYTVRVYADLSLPALPCDYTRSIDYEGGDVYEECYLDLMTIEGFNKA